MEDAILIKMNAPAARVFRDLLMRHDYRCTYSQANVEIGVYVINPVAKTFKWTANFTNIPSDMTIEDFTDLFL